MSVYSPTGLRNEPMAVTANAAVQVSSAQMWSYDSFLATCTRNEAMAVPAVARARNIIAGTIGTLPLYGYDDVTGRRLYGRQLLKQMDPAVPQPVTIGWLVEDLMFHGVGYVQVLELDPESGRPIRARRIDPQRVFLEVDSTTQNVTQMRVDGQAVPMYGVGSLIVFNGMDDGILARGGRTIRTALNLERAASNMADEPVPATVIKNSGVDLPPEQVASLLSKWREARRTRSTAYLSSNLDVQSFGFDASSLQLVESRQHVATEIARLCNIPAWYLNADQAGMTYSNVTQERRSLIDFSLRFYLTVIESRLSMDDVTARGTVVRFSLDNYLRGNPLEQVDTLGKMQEYGWIDADEARAMLDLAPRGNNDQTRN